MVPGSTPPPNRRMDPKPFRSLRLSVRVTALVSPKSRIKPSVSRGEARTGMHSESTTGDRH